MIDRWLTTKPSPRVRDVLALEPDVDEERMFGGLAFLVVGHMCCGIVKIIGNHSAERWQDGPRDRSGPVYEPEARGRSRLA